PLITTFFSYTTLFRSHQRHDMFFYSMDYLTVLPDTWMLMNPLELVFDQLVADTLTHFLHECNLLHSLSTLSGHHNLQQASNPYFPVPPLLNSIHLILVFLLS